VLLQQRSGSYLVVSEKLAPYGFVRIRRSTLVNRWGYILRIRGRKEYTETPSYKKDAKFLACFWFLQNEFDRRPILSTA
jgi:hypothetical protein